MYRFSPEHPVIDLFKHYIIYDWGYEKCKTCLSSWVRLQQSLLSFYQYNTETFCLWLCWWNEPPAVSSFRVSESTRSFRADRLTCGGLSCLLSHFFWVKCLKQCSFFKDVRLPSLPIWDEVIQPTLITFNHIQSELSRELPHLRAYEQVP